MKKILALILAAVMLFSLAACRKDDTAAPDTDLTETNNAANPEEERAKKAALLLEDLRSRPLYTEVETIENDRCYVIRGYFSGTPSGITYDIYAVRKDGGWKNLYPSVYPYFAYIEDLSFSKEDDSILIVKGQIPIDGKEEYTSATAEINIYTGEVINRTEEPKEIVNFHQGENLKSPYSPFVDGVAYRQGTFSEKYPYYMDSFDEMDGKWEHDRPALLWHLAQEMDLTREDFEVYFAALDVDDVPEFIYEGLMADTLEESMQLLKSDLAFYYDGKLYTVYDIYDMYENGTLPFDITDPAYDEVWKNISYYLELQEYEEVPRDVYLLVRERAHDPVWRLYFWHSSQYGYNVCSSYPPGSGIDCFSILDCDTYEAQVGSMNERYAPVVDGTVFIYDYINGEKVCDIPISPDGCHIDFIEYSSEKFPRYLSVTPNFSLTDYSTRLYDIEKQEFVPDEPFVSCVIPKGTDLLCKTVESDGKFITTAYRVGTLEEVLSVEGMIYSAEIDEKTVLAVTGRNVWTKNVVLAFYDTDGNELTGLGKYKTGFDFAPWFDHIIYYHNK